MASVNAADRGITSSHNFWLPMADACCQTVEELLSFVTFSMAATDLDPDQLVLRPKTSHRSLPVTLCLPAIICQLTQETMLKVFSLQWWSCHLNAFDKVTVSRVLCWFFFSYVVILFQKSFPYITKSRTMVQKFQPFHRPVSVTYLNKSTSVLFLS